jgi:hypothetical protein
MVLTELTPPDGVRVMMSPFGARLSALAAWTVAPRARLATVARMIVVNIVVLRLARPDRYAPRLMGRT